MGNASTRSGPYSAWSISTGPEFEGLDGRKPKQKHILRADNVTDFNFGAVSGAKRERAIQGELHIPRAGSPRTRSRDVLGEIGTWDYDAHKRYFVIRDENEPQSIAHARVSRERRRNITAFQDPPFRGGPRSPADGVMRFAISSLRNPRAE